MALPLDPLGSSTSPASTLAETQARQAQARLAASDDVVSAAEQFEGVMIHELMKAMRSTVPGDDKGFAMDTAYSMFDQAIADSAAGAMGLAPMIARDMGATEAQLASMRGTGVAASGARGAGGAVNSVRGLDAYRAAARPSTPDAAWVRTGNGAHDGHDHAYVGPTRNMPHAGVWAGGAPQPGLDPVEGIVSSEYGWRVHPITKEKKFHEGLDIAAPEGTEIRAVADGTVVFAGRRGGYGNVVELRHDDGTVTRYAHASRIHVQRGDRIEVGEAVADVGQTGHATGPHLHFEVRRDGKAVNPKRYLDSLRRK